MVYREYGRTVNKIIDKVCEMEDGEKKDEAVRSLVGVMGLVGGFSVKDDVSYRKLWDHLMILSDFRLERSWPFEAEELQKLKERHAAEGERPLERLPYKNNNIKSRQYGIYLEKMLKKMKEVPDGEEYDALATLVAQQTKRDYLVWNGDLPDDNIVVRHMSVMSGDERLEEKLTDTPIVVPPNTMPTDFMSTKKKKKKK